MRNLRPLGVLVLTLATTIATTTALSSTEPLVVFDREITITNGTQHWPVRPGLPTDWTAPIDYTAGDCYVYWEVLEAPADGRDYVLQLGWTFPSSGPGQSDRNFHLLRFKYQHLLPDAERYAAPVFEAGAVWETRHHMNHRSYFWPVEQRDYSNGIAGMMAHCRTYPGWDVRGPSGPVRLRVTMTLVPPGAEYQPPATYGGLRASELPDLPTVGAAMLARTPGRALALAEGLVGQPGAVGEQAAIAVAALGAHLDDQIAAVTAQWQRDPFGAATALAAVLADATDTSRAEGLRELASSWRGDRRLREAKRAQAVLERTRALVARIRERVPADADLSQPAVARRVQRELRDLGATYLQLKRDYRDSVQFEHAGDLLRSLGIDPPER